MEPGQTFTITLTAAIPASVVRGDEFVNHVAMTADLIPVAVENEAQVRVFGPMIEPTLTKSVDEPTAVVGERRTYTLTTTFAPDQLLYDAAVMDVLPDGLHLDSIVSAACISGCGAGTPEPQAMTATTNSSGATTHGWWLGTVQTTETAAVYEFTYTAYMSEFLADGVTETSGTASFTNIAMALSNPLPVVVAETGGTPPSTFDCTDCDCDGSLGPSPWRPGVQRPRPTASRSRSGHRLALRRVVQSGRARGRFALAAGRPAPVR